VIRQDLHSAIRSIVTRPGFAVVVVKGKGDGSYVSSDAPAPGLRPVVP
jgi:hypothetical protein